MSIDELSRPVSVPINVGRRRANRLGVVARSTRRRVSIAIGVGAPTGSAGTVDAHARHAIAMATATTHGRASCNARVISPLIIREHAVRDAWTRDTIDRGPTHRKCASSRLRHDTRHASAKRAAERHAENTTFVRWSIDAPLDTVRHGVRRVRRRADRYSVGRLSCRQARIVSRGDRTRWK